MLNVAGSAVLLALCAPLAMAQTWPVKPVRIISPFAPGGGNDTLSRILAASLTQRLGQQVIVENRPGANTIVGTEWVVKAPPDGYTLIVLPNAVTINPHLYGKMSFDILKDLAPVSHIGASAQVLVTHPSFPARTMKDFVAFAKSKPGEITNGSSGNGSIGHLTGALLDMLAGTRLVHVPYKGTSLATTDLLGGQIVMMFGSALGVVPHVRTKRLNAIALSSSRRTPALPDLPTAAETLPGFAADLSYALFAPAHTPADIVNRLNREVTATLADTTVKGKLSDQGVDAYPSTPAELASLMKAEFDKWGKVVKATGARVN